MGAINLVPVPDIKSEEISSLTQRRQDIIISLWHGDKTLSRIADSEDVDSSVSTVSKSIEKLDEIGFVDRDQNKVYSLTGKGEGVALMIAEPNGMSEQEYRQELTKWLKERLLKNSYTAKTAEEKAEDLAEVIRELGSGISGTENQQQSQLEA